MKYLMFMVRLLDMLTGSGFYEMTRYSNGTGLNLSTSKFMAWRRRTARRLWSLEAMHMLVPIFLVGFILATLTTVLAVPGVAFLLIGLLIMVVLTVLFPPMALILA